VLAITVAHFVKAESLIICPEDRYFACLNPSCDVAYFNVATHRVFYTQELKEPIWYKKNAKPKIICYCNKVTDEDIINAALNKGARTVKEAIKITGAMKNSNCRINNPLSKCCMPAIQNIFNATLNRSSNNQ